MPHNNLSPIFLAGIHEIKMDRDMLRNSGIDVSFGLLAGEAARLNEIYLKHIRTKRPFVILKSAMTLDGKIATRTGDSRWVSGEESRLQVRRRSSPSWHPDRCASRR